MTSAWARYLDEAGPWSDPTSREGKIFRQRFRVTYAVFKQLLQMHRSNSDFSESCDAVGRPSVPLGLKILGALRVLGRAHVFDDIAECTNTDEEVHRTFFHSFVKVYSTKYVPLFINMPGSEEELAASMAEYWQAGLPGCVGAWVLC